jgi:hypothetical protein
VSGKVGQESAERLDPANASFPPQDIRQFLVKFFVGVNILNCMLAALQA